MKIRDRQLKVLAQCESASRRTAPGFFQLLSGKIEYSEQVRAFEALAAEHGTTGSTVLGLLNRAYTATRLSRDPAALRPDPVDEAYRAAAKEEHVSEGTLEIDPEATVSRSSDGGAYIAAWVWVNAGDAALCSESDCHAPLDDGEGYDGKCGPCADQAALEAADQAADR